MLRLPVNSVVCTALVGSVAALVSAGSTSAEIIGFEDLTLPGPNSFYNGNPGNPPVNTPIDGTFMSGSATFVNTFTRVDAGFGPFDTWEGWSYSNVTDQSTPGFANQFSAYNPANAGGGAAGSERFGVSFGDDAWVRLPDGRFFEGFDITNTTYTALSMLNGDSFAKKFGGGSGTDPDFFRVTISGRTGGPAGAEVYSTDFYLADYRFADSQNDYVIQDWTTVNLLSLGSADTLVFRYASSDIGDFGINTPLYFAADNFRAVSIPEPGTATALLVLLGGFSARRLISSRRSQANTGVRVCTGSPAHPDLDRSCFTLSLAGSSAARGKADSRYEHEVTGSRRPFAHAHIRLFRPREGEATRKPLRRYLSPIRPV